MTKPITPERVQELRRLNEGQPDSHKLTFGDYRAIDLTIAELRALLAAYGRECECGWTMDAWLTHGEPDFCADCGGKVKVTR